MLDTLIITGDMQSHRRFNLATTSCALATSSRARVASRRYGLGYSVLSSCWHWCTVRLMSSPPAPTGYVGLSPTACVRRFRYSGESEQVGLRLLPPRSAAWSSATSFSATRIVLRRRASPRDLTRRSCVFLQNISRCFGAHKGGDGLR
jgi:hypothetical protein